MFATSVQTSTEKRLLNNNSYSFVDCQQLNQKRQVKLKTCADVYDYWRTCKRQYKKAPKDGVEFQVDYIDTGLALSEELRSKAPIALALHGAPGSYHDFALLINHLSQQNVRVIAPNFPEYVATVKTKVLFRHSADEKAAYLRDFLKAINVNKIDLLVSHSSAIFPTLLILLNANEQAIRKRREEGSFSKSNKSNVNLQNGTGLCNKKKDKEKDSFYIHTLGEETKTGSFCQHENEIFPKGDKADASDDDEDVDDEAEDEEVDDLDKCKFTEIEDPTNAGGLRGKDEENFEDAKDELDGNNNNHTSNRNKKASASLNDSNGYKNQTTLSTTKPEPFNETSNNCNIQTKSKRKKKKNLEVLVSFEQPIEIKAVALLNPAGHRLPKSMKPTWFKCGSVRIYQHKLGRSLFRKLGPAFLTVVGVPVRVDNMDNVMLSATVMRNSKCQRVVKQLEQLSQMKLPTLLVFSENDKLIEKEIFYEMSRFMKLDQKNFDIFNNDGDIELTRKYLNTIAHKHFCYLFAYDFHSTKQIRVTISTLFPTNILDFSLPLSTVCAFTIFFSDYTYIKNITIYKYI